MKFGGGYLKDSPEKRTQVDFATHHKASTPLPASVSLRDCEAKPTLDQGDGGSCTGHGSSQALSVSFKAAGLPLPFVPSPKSIYAIARTFEADGADVPLTDSGAMPADAMAAINVFGIRAMAKPPSPEGYNTDVDASNITEKEDLEALEQAGHKVVVGEHRINENASNWTGLVQAALASKCAVCIGIFVDSAFENWTPKEGPLDKVNLNDPNGGGHWLCVVGYETVNGVLVFDLLNSWGSAFGDDGHIQVTESWMHQAVSDVYPIIPALAT